MLQKHQKHIQRLSWGESGGVCVLGKRSGYGSGVWATQVWKP